MSVNLGVRTSSSRFWRQLCSLNPAVCCIFIISISASSRLNLIRPIRCEGSCRSSAERTSLRKASNLTRARLRKRVQPVVSCDYELRILSRL